MTALKIRTYANVSKAMSDTVNAHQAIQANIRNHARRHSEAYDARRKVAENDRHIADGIARQNS